MTIDIALIDEVQEELDTDYEVLYNSLCKVVLDYEEVVEDVELSILLVSEDKIKDINSTYRSIDKVTDVISFALEEEQMFILEGEPRNLGDIFICVQRAKEQALEYGHSFKREMAFLFVHGMLHLLGYDHIKEEDEKIMIQKQNAILALVDIGRENDERI